MGPTAYVTYYDSINEQKVRTFMLGCANVIAEAKPSKLYFLFSSGGGSIDAGVALFNFLRALPVPIVMHNIGSIDSVANVIFLAADERYAAPHASFLFHGIKWNFGQGAQLDWTQLNETLSRFKADEAKIAGIISQRTSMTSEELKQLFHQGQAKDVAFALEKGVIQAVREAKVPEGSPFYTITCQ